MNYGFYFFFLYIWHELWIGWRPVSLILNYITRWMIELSDTKNLYLLETYKQEKSTFIFTTVFYWTEKKDRKVHPIFTTVYYVLVWNKRWSASNLYLSTWRIGRLYSIAGWQTVGNSDLAWATASICTDWSTWTSGIWPSPPWLVSPAASPHYWNSVLCRLPKAVGKDPKTGGKSFADCFTHGSRQRTRGKEFIGKETFATCQEKSSRQSLCHLPV